MPEKPIVSDYSSTRTTILPPSSANSLDLRGKRVHEAESEIDVFLDNACRKNMLNAYIIHGHGTGAMKEFVRDMLSYSPYIESFRPGERGEGGDGVTMVMLQELGS